MWHDHVTRLMAPTRRQPITGQPTAGISPSVLQLLRACQHVVLAVCDEPASMTDAYAIVKVLSRSYGVSRFQVVASMARERGAGEN